MSEQNHFERIRLQEEAANPMWRFYVAMAVGAALAVLIGVLGAFWVTNTPISSVL